MFVIVAPVNSIPDMSYISICKDEYLPANGFQPLAEGVIFSVVFAIFKDEIK